MLILVANLGSTSFKYRLFDMADERVLARGGVERIGAAQSSSFVESAGRRDETMIVAADHAVAVKHCLKQLVERGCLKDTNDLGAIGFKTVHAQRMTGVHIVDENLLAAMETYNEICPAHNPPYVSAMRLLARELPAIPLVASLESGFHQTIPAAQSAYAIPSEWAASGEIRRWGFHGASHRYIAERAAHILKKPDAKIISCHLGGSSSLCAIRAGQSVATSMGMTPQSGLPQNNRVGDFDSFALPILMKQTGKSLEQLLSDLANRAGLLGMSGFNDLRDIERAMVDGNVKAQAAFDVYVASVRHYLGSYLLLLNGADAIVFTGGIGENSQRIRAAVCANLDWFGIYLDPSKNADVKGEMPIHAVNSRIEIWTMPTNEELIVARQCVEVLDQAGRR